jgi:thioredoxin reductase
MNASELYVTEVAIIGGGPAGIAAAVRVAESGRRAVIVDEGPNLGGQIWRHRPETVHKLPANARRWLDRLRAASGAITVLSGTSVVDARQEGGDSGFTLSGERAHTHCLVRAKAVIVATGARERWIPFPGWTLPGVFGVGGAQALLKSGVSFRGKRVIIAGTGPLILPVAAALAKDGARLLLVAEQAASASVASFALGLWRKPGTLAQAAKYRAAFRGTPYRMGQWITAARGDGHVEEVDITDGQTTRTIACDAACVGFGLVPNLELARLLGCELTSGAVQVDARQQTSRAGVYSAGEIAGIGGVEVALAEGEIAGLCASGRSAEARRLMVRRARLRKSLASMERAFAPRDELRALTTAETIVCRCEDVAFGAITRAAGLRQAKLYTRAGMGPCQGRVCGASLEFLLGWNADSVRVPSEPVLLSTLMHAMPNPSPSITETRS